MQRYAVYFAPPPDTPLWRFGSAVLGYDAATGRPVSHPDRLRSIDAEWPALSAEPRRYGFHATLKAPFETNEGIEPSMVEAGVAGLAARLTSVALPGLVVAELGRFIALVPREASPALMELAGGVATDSAFDQLRRPLSEADRARRLRTTLSPRQQHYLERFGYPYVLEEFRFHMTLTGPIADRELRQSVRATLADLYAEAVPQIPLHIDALTLFFQPRRDGPFHIVTREPLPAPRA